MQGFPDAEAESEHFRAVAAHFTPRTFATDDESGPDNRRSTDPRATCRSDTRTRHGLIGAEVG